ncbi:uncharacterized protein [Cherax quadricarinatus]
MSERPDEYHWDRRDPVPMLPLLLCAVGVRLAWAACLNHLFCYNDLYLDHSRFVTIHSDLAERSAVTCGTLCLQRWPETHLVLAKLVDVNQLLACGCGSQLAVGNLSGKVNDYYDCYVCPDGDNQKCGSEKTTSVYEVEHTNHSCRRVHLTVPEKIIFTSTTTTSTDPPTTHVTHSISPWQNSSMNYTKIETMRKTTTHLASRKLSGSPTLGYLGCYEEMMINESAVVTTLLQRPGVNITHCARSCLLTHPSTQVFLLKLLNMDRIYCGCGMEVALAWSAEGTGHCDLYCRDDPRQPCGGWVSVSAYARITSASESRLSRSSLLLFLPFLVIFWV